MNFLAHFHLAWPHPELLLGALEGDFHKGRLQGRLSPGLEAGIQLHRTIDAFTDKDRAVAALRDEFPRDLRRFAGIAIDLMFDHHLARNWHCYSDQPLAEFCTAVYRLLSVRGAQLSPSAHAMAQVLRQHDLLQRYGQWPTIDRALADAGRRLRRGCALLEAGTRLVPLQRATGEAFSDFYPRLQRHVTRQKPTLLQSGSSACLARGIKLA